MMTYQKDRGAPSSQIWQLSNKLNIGLINYKSLSKVKIHKSILLNKLSIFASS